MPAPTLAPPPSRPTLGFALSALHDCRSAVAAAAVSAVADGRAVVPPLPWPLRSAGAANPPPPPAGQPAGRGLGAAAARAALRMEVAAVAAMSVTAEVGAVETGTAAGRGVAQPRPTNEAGERAPARCVTRPLGCRCVCVQLVQDKGLWVHHDGAKRQSRRSGPPNS